MADRSDKIATGRVTEALPNASFRVRLDDESEVFAYLSGKMRMHRIKVFIGDSVQVEMSEYGGAKGRIIKRL